MTDLDLFLFGIFIGALVTYVAASVLPAVVIVGVLIAAWIGLGVWFMRAWWRRG